MIKPRFKTSKARSSGWRQRVTLLLPDKWAATRASGWPRRISDQPVFEFPLALVIFVGISLFTFHTQHINTVNNGQGWDGSFYFKIAEQIAALERPRGIAPYIYRVGTPLLATLLQPSKLLVSFLAVNIIASFLFTILLLVWLRLHISSWAVRLLLLVMALVNWLGPVRFIYFYPTISDPWALVILLSGLICIAKMRANPSLGLMVSLCLICLVGPFFREITVILGLAAIFSRNPVCYPGRLRITKPASALVLPLGCALLGLIVNHLSVIIEPSDYSFSRQSAYWFYNQPFIMYSHSWLIAYGPVLFLLIFGLRGVGGFLWKHQYQFVYLAFILGLAWIGGDDTERYALWAMPIIYVLCGKVMEEKAATLRAVLPIAILVSTQAISERLFWVIPDEWGGRHPLWALFTPMANVSYLNLFPRHQEGGSTLHLYLSFLEYSITGFALIGYLFYREKKMALQLLSQTR